MHPTSPVTAIPNPHTLSPPPYPTHPSHSLPFVFRKRSPLGLGLLLLILITSQLLLFFFFSMLFEEELGFFNIRVIATETHGTQETIQGLAFLLESLQSWGISHMGFRFSQFGSLCFLQLLPPFEVWGLIWCCSVENFGVSWCFTVFGILGLVILSLKFLFFVVGFFFFFFEFVCWVVL